MRLRCRLVFDELIHENPHAEHEDYIGDRTSTFHRLSRQLRHTACACYVAAAGFFPSIGWFMKWRSTRRWKARPRGMEMAMLRGTVTAATNQSAEVPISDIKKPSS